MNEIVRKYERVEMVVLQIILAAIAKLQGGFLPPWIEEMETKTAPPEFNYLSVVGVEGVVNRNSHPLPLKATVFLTDVKKRDKGVDSDIRDLRGIDWMGNLTLELHGVSYVFGFNVFSNRFMELERYPDPPRGQPMPDGVECRSLRETT